MTCSDNVECIMGSEDCAIDACCTNTVGSFSCACHEGDDETYSVIAADFCFFRSFWIFRARKVQNFPARLISSELSAHQMSPSGDSALAGTPH